MWVPKPGTLRAWRDLRRMSVKTLVQRSNVKERTIRKLESREPPGTMHDDTVRHLAAALSDPAHGVICTPEHLAYWRNADGQLVDALVAPPPSGPTGAEVPVAPAAPPKGDPDFDNE